MKKFLKSLLSQDGEMSSRRFISLIAFFMLCIGFLANQFLGLPIAEFIYESMVWVVGLGMGALMADKFSTKKLNDKENEK